MSPQNPDLDSEALLALPLPQLVQKLHSGDLSPEAVLFTYMGKVRPFFLQGIFPTRGSNLGLPHCRQMLYPLSQPGKPKDGTKQNKTKL